MKTDNSDESFFSHIDDLDKIWKDRQDKSSHKIIKDDVIFEASRKFIKDVCNSLAVSTSEYDAKKTFDIIRDYQGQKDKLPRIFYYSLTNNIYRADSVTKEKIDQNITNLGTKVFHDYLLKKEDSVDESLFEVYAGDELDDKAAEVFFKIFDHINLAEFQMERIRNETKELYKNAQSVADKFHSRVEEVEKKLDKSQREYVAILGIFASIVTVSMGGINYVSSVFNALQEVTALPTLIGLTTIIGMVVISLAGIMTNLIFQMTGKQWVWEVIVVPATSLAVVGSIMYWLAK